MHNPPLYMSKRDSKRVQIPLESEINLWTFTTKKSVATVLHLKITKKMNIHFILEFPLSKYKINTEYLGYDNAYCIESLKGRLIVNFNFEIYTFNTDTLYMTVRGRYLES
jgi:hypothetical protein